MDKARELNPKMGLMSGSFEDPGGIVGKECYLHNAPYFPCHGSRGRVVGPEFSLEGLTCTLQLLGLIPPALVATPGRVTVSA